MQAQNGISRRHILRTAMAVGGLAMAGGVRGVRAQAAKKIEQLAPELDNIISPAEPIQELADGFGGPQGPAEGPVWWKDGGYLLFSDIHNNRRMKYTPGQGVSVFQEPTNRANGLTRDLQGRLLACEHDSRRVTRQELDGSLTVIANSFQGGSVAKLGFGGKIRKSGLGKSMACELQLSCFRYFATEPLVVLSKPSVRIPRTRYDGSCWSAAC